MSTRRAATFGDTVAIGLSGLCLAHCLALPIFASLLPIAGAWAEAAWVHWLFVGDRCAGFARDLPPPEKTGSSFDRARHFGAGFARRRRGRVSDPRV